MVSVRLFNISATIYLKLTDGVDINSEVYMHATR